MKRGNYIIATSLSSMGYLILRMGYLGVNHNVFRPGVRVDNCLGGKVFEDILGEIETFISELNKITKAPVSIILGIFRNEVIKELCEGVYLQSDTQKHEEHNPKPKTIDQQYSENLRKFLSDYGAEPSVIGFFEECIMAAAKKSSPKEDEHV